MRIYTAPFEDGLQNHAPWKDLREYAHKQLSGYRHGTGCAKACSLCETSNPGIAMYCPMTEAVRDESGAYSMDYDYWCCVMSWVIRRIQGKGGQG